jgi:hypothetical protein
MQDVLTWGALIAAGGSLVAIVTFWMNRGKAEADALAKADTANATAHAALAKRKLSRRSLRKRASSLPATTPATRISPPPKCAMRRRSTACAPSCAA